MELASWLLKGIHKMKQDVFSNYLNEYFVETGTYIGNGVEAALKYGFKHIYSIELSDELYYFCKKKFSDKNNVEIIHGDSGEKLLSVISEINEPITFWLDGHFHPGGKNRADNPENYVWGKSSRDNFWTPIWRELSEIKAHPIKIHTIIIDDMREFSKECYGKVKIQSIKEKILSINSDYKFRFHTGAVENDILAAYL